MQPLLDGPRAGLTEDQVRALLQSHSSIRFAYGADALDENFALVADISDYVSGGGSVVSDSTRAVHRTCTLNIDATVTDTGWSYLSGYVRPWTSITDMATGLTARFNEGVYTLPSAPTPLGQTPAMLQFSGYDLIYLLRQEVGDSYEVPAGSDPAVAAATVIELAIPGVTVNVSASGSTTTTQLSWPFDASQPTLWSDIVSVLLKSIGYRDAWVDWDGTFRIEPWTDLQLAQPEWVFDRAADDSIVAASTSRDIDLYTVPNWWKFVMANLTDLPVEGVTMYTVTDASAVNLGSSMNRKRIQRHIEQVSATSYTDLVNYANKAITASLKPTETLSASTQPFPLAWHYDVLQYLDQNLPGDAERRAVATGWTLPLDGASDMTWTWETITDQTAVLGLA